MSNERSPREVCSITIGINGLIQRSFELFACRLAISDAARAEPMRLTVTPQAASRVSALLACGGPQFRLGLRLFLFGSPDRLARSGKLDRDLLDLGGHLVERGAQAQVLPKDVQLPRLAHLVDDRPGVLPRRLGLLANLRLDLALG